MTKHIMAKAANTEGKVVLWETHPDHITTKNKTGEVWISGNGRAVEVAATPKVQRLLADGALVEVKGTTPAAIAPPTEPKKTAKAEA